MYMPTIEFHQATSISETFDLLRRFGPAARLLAGGTDLLVDLKAKRVTADHVISISRIADLRGVSRRDGALRIGALTTITELDESQDLGKEFEPIRDATQCMAVRQIRNVATVGGNLASAVPCADLPPILMTMGACVCIASPSGEREIPLRDFLIGVRQTALGPEDILTTVVVPQPPDGFGAAYARFGLREGNAIAVAAAAAGLKLSSDGTIEDATIALGAVSPVAIIAPNASSLLCGNPPTAALFAKAAGVAKDEVNPISDIRGSATFRKDLVVVLVQRALAKATQRAGGQLR